MKSFHFVGIGGIGMSALAAGAAASGWQITGSDRSAGQKENQAIFDALRSQGIKIFDQDGSRFAAEEKPDALVYSTAIEDDNPDFLAAGNDIPKLHRSEFLRMLLDKFSRNSIAVTGSCGKSSVTAYITETLERLGADPAMISGALSKRYRNRNNAGNFRMGNGKFLVFEADESDKSLLAYGADYAVILNIGTDHYEKDELVRVFSIFLQNIRKGAVISRQVADAMAEKLPGHLNIIIFDDDSGDKHYALRSYHPGKSPCAFAADGRKISLPAPGKHTALNTLAVRALCGMLGFDDTETVSALSSFDGVWRRNDFAGHTRTGAAVYDDYAHNPEKIISCLGSLRENTSGRLFGVFQPHGYKPFGFMEDALFRELDKFLRDGDRFILLEPFYAGGTSSFSPHSEDVCSKWKSLSARPERFMFMPDRETLAGFLKSNCCDQDIIVIMGARDNSLSFFASDLTL